jgi:polysaccharide export outer membrane protein
MYNKYLTIFLLMVVFYTTSCVDTRKYTYFNDSKDANIIPNAADTIIPVIQKNDILSIIITSLNPEASAVFNMNTTMSAGVTTSAGGGQTATGYLVNEDGYVQLPILGNIKVAGLTTKMIKQNITSIILQKKLLTDPIVTIRHLNYEITVIGEVNKPAVITVPSEKISLIKALGLAGDITVYGKKDNVLLIREINGKRTVKRIDLNATDFLTSPNYYLQPNDVVYVETNKNKLESVSAVKQSLPIVLSSLSVLLIVLDRLVR